MPWKVKGKTHCWPAAGPELVVQAALVPEGAAVVEAVVEAVVVEGVVVVDDVVVVERAAVVEGEVVEVVVEAPGQVEGQTPSDPMMWVPTSVMLVEHQAWELMSAVRAQEE